MKILVVTHSYAPDLTPRAFRWTALAEQLAQRGHEVHVVCAAKASAGLPTPTDRLRIHRVPDRIMGLRGRSPAGVPAGLSPARESMWSTVGGVLKALARRLWRAVHWPDYACGWIVPAAAKARRLCRENRFDWVVSVSHPFSGHMVPLLMRGKGSGVRWLVDIGDPFSLMAEPAPNNRMVFGPINRWVEARVLERADVISVTTEATRHLYETHFKEAGGKVHLLPPMLSLPTCVQSSLGKPTGIVRLVFVGTLYARLRSPRFLLSCLAALKQSLDRTHPEVRVELHFYGSTNDCAEQLREQPPEIGGAVIIHGLVDRGEVLAAMRNADILVNIGNDSESQLASKVIEYMAIGKPILNLVSHPQDASVAAIGDYPALTLSRATGLADPVIAELCSFVLAPPPVPERIVAEVRAKYSSARIAADYERILCAVRA